MTELNINKNVFARVKPSKSCSSGWDIREDRFLGGGAFGQVFNTCCGDDCDYVAKIQPVDAMVDSEIEFQNIAAKGNISVPILDSWIYEKTQVFITQALQITLEKYIEMITESSMTLSEKADKLTPVICQLLEKIYRLVYKLGIDHNDIKPDNIMLDKRGEVFLIDFGLAVKIKGAQFTTLANNIDAIIYMIDTGDEEDLSFLLLKNIKNCKLPEEIKYIIDDISLSNDE